MTTEFTQLPESIRDQWPFEPRYARVNGWRMHFVDEGRGDPILLLHGNPTWGFLYRDVIPLLVEAGYRVIVPDMVGFGLSEKPTREHAHSLDAHASNLLALIRQLGLTKLTMVCHDWGGPTGLSAAMTDKDRIRALVVMSTWAWALPPAALVALNATGRIATVQIAKSVMVQPGQVGALMRLAFDAAMARRALRARALALLPHAEPRSGVMDGVRSDDLVPDGVL